MHQSESKNDHFMDRRPLSQSYNKKVSSPRQAICSMKPVIDTSSVSERMINQSMTLHTVGNCTDAEPVLEECMSSGLLSMQLKFE